MNPEIQPVSLALNRVTYLLVSPTDASLAECEALMRGVFCRVQSLPSSQIKDSDAKNQLLFIRRLLCGIRDFWSRFCPLDSQGNAYLPTGLLLNNAQNSSFSLEA